MSLAQGIFAVLDRALSVAPVGQRSRPASHDSLPPPMDPNAAHAAYRKTNYFAPLDAARFLAITLVVWHHTPRESPEAEVWAVAGRGFLGIDVFFLLSGFLIVTLFLRERDKLGQASLWQLFVRRALRLFPLYYAMLATFALVFWLVRPDGSLAAGFFHNLPYYLTFTSNWVELGGFISTYWTLSTQEQFYLLWPVVERYAARWSVPVALGVIGLSQAVNFRLTAPLELALGLDYAKLALLQVTPTPLMLGVLLAHLLHRPEDFRLAWRVFGWRGTPLVALALAAAAASLPAASMTGLPRLSYQLAITLAVGGAVAHPGHFLRRALTFKPIIRLGQVCYGIFLFHMVTTWALEKVGGRVGLQGGWPFFLVNYLLAYGLAELSYRYFETPFLRLRDRLRNRLPPAASARAG